MLTTFSSECEVIFISELLTTTEESLAKIMPTHSHIHFLLGMILAFLTLELQVQ